MNDQKGGLEMLNILISILSSSLLTMRVVWCEAWRQLSAMVGVQTLEVDSSWIPALPLTICVKLASCLTSLCFYFVTYTTGLIVLDS